jgi:hypothetical protein
MNLINKSKTCLFGISVLSTLTSCATIMHGTHQAIGISSNPTNASVWVDQAYAGNTPVILGLTRRDNHIVRIEMEGYQPYEAVFTRQLSGWVFGNIVFGGVIGLAVDAISGGIYMLTPEQIQAEMRPGQMTCSRQSNDSFITVVLEPNQSWKKIGNLVASK